MQKMALVAAGVIFSLVAIFHFIRALYAVAEINRIRIKRIYLIKIRCSIPVWAIGLQHRRLSGDRN